MNVGRSSWKPLLLSVFAAVGAAAPTNCVAYATSCVGAETNFRKAKSGLQKAADEYAACVKSSEGRDDCMSAFRRLRDRQSDFVTAIADLDGNCPED